MLREARASEVAVVLSCGSGSDLTRILYGSYTERTSVAYPIPMVACGASAVRASSCSEAHPRRWSVRTARPLGIPPFHLAALAWGVQTGPDSQRASRLGPVSSRFRKRRVSLVQTWTAGQRVPDEVDGGSG